MIDNLPQTLRLWRESAGLTREQAALKLQVSFRSYVRWETGNSTPKGLAQLANIKRQLTTVKPAVS